MFQEAKQEKKLGHEDNKQADGRRGIKMVRWRESQQVTKRGPMFAT